MRDPADGLIILLCRTQVLIIPLDTLLPLQPGYIRCIAKLVYKVRIRVLADTVYNRARRHPIFIDG